MGVIEGYVWCVLLLLFLVTHTSLSHSCISCLLCLVCTSHACVWCVRLMPVSGVYVSCLCLLPDIAAPRCASCRAGGAPVQINKVAARTQTAQHLVKT